MFDWLQNLGKSAEEKRQEALTAYLDNALTPSQRQVFERQLAQDAGLQRDLEQQRRLKMQLRQLPRVAAPRNFTLNPAVYGRQLPARPNRTYPILRTATALVAFFFVLALVVDFSTGLGDWLETVAMSGEAPAGQPTFASDVQSEAVEEETAEEDEPAEEEEAPEEEMAEEPEAEPTEAAEEEEAAGDAAGEIAPAVPLATMATATVMGTADSGVVTLQPELLNTITTTASYDIADEGAGLPRPTTVPTLTGREGLATATLLPPAVVSDTAVLPPATPLPQTPLTDLNNGDGVKPDIRFWVIELALGATLVIFLILTLLARRRL